MREASGNQEPFFVSCYQKVSNMNRRRVGSSEAIVALVLGWVGGKVYPHTHKPTTEHDDHDGLRTTDHDGREE